MRDEQEIYESVLGLLRKELENHVSGPNSKGGIMGFCSKYKISRQNMTKILAGKHTMSLGVFMRITEALGIMQYPVEQLEEEVNQLNLRLYLKMQPAPILAMIKVALKQ